jgi:hypothetical protein
LTFVKKKGYNIILATMRHASEADADFKQVMKKVDQTIFTGRQAKMPFLTNLGIRPDLWMDDIPYFIMFDA